MAFNKDDTISILNNLIQVCRDGEEGYRMAGDGVRDNQLQSLFLTFAQQRAQCANELQDEVRRLGGDAEDSGSLSGSMHRGWMNIKAAVTGKDENAIIAECERGDRMAVETYEMAVEKIQGEFRSVLSRQLNEIKGAYDRIRTLERITS